MIIRKPYAFLIKNFRIIHILLSVLLAYVSLKSMSIYNFFNSYAKEGHYTFYANLVNKFVNFYMFVAVIIIIIVVATLLILLRWKNKKRLFYIIVLIFYIAVFLVFIYIINTLKTIQTTELDIKTIRITRDIMLMTTFPQYGFIVFLIFRGLGFDIKKFNFGKDLKDLEIDIKDNEEVELMLAKDTYKYMRTFRRILRELRYFALENRFVFLVITIIVVLGTTLGLYLNREVYNKIYKEEEKFIANSLTMNVENSYISSYDYSGNIILKGKSYVIVEINITNNGKENLLLERDNFKLIINNKTFYPNLNKEIYFRDLGKMYSNEKIKPQETSNYLFIFEIDDKYISSEYLLKVINNVKVLQGNIDADYRNIIIKPINLNDFKEEQEVFINEKLTFNNSILNNLELNVKSFSISQTFNEVYNYCINGGCYEGIKIVKPESIGKRENTIIKLETDYKYDNSYYISKYIKTSSNFINQFASLEYVINEKTKTSKINTITSKYLKDNNVFIEVPKEIESATNIKLKFIIRNNIYSIILK